MVQSLHDRFTERALEPYKTKTYLLNWGYSQNLVASGWETLESLLGVSISSGMLPKDITGFVEIVSEVVGYLKMLVKELFPEVIEVYIDRSNKLGQLDPRNRDKWIQFSEILGEFVDGCGNSGAKSRSD